VAASTDHAQTRGRQDEGLINSREARTKRMTL
jgi:hypothetical protein